LQSYTGEVKAAKVNIVKTCAHRDSLKGEAHRDQLGISKNENEQLYIPGKCEKVYIYWYFFPVDVPSSSRWDWCKLSVIQKHGFFLFMKIIYTKQVRKNTP